MTFLNTVIPRLSAILTAALLMLSAPATQAHPLGQNALNREAAILVQADSIQVDYLLDLAEVPTLSVGELADVDRDGKVTDAEWTGYTERWAKMLPGTLVIEVGGKPLALSLESQTWRIAPGQSGLSTLRLQARLRAPVTLSEATAALDFRDQTSVNRLGWKEIWISAANGARIVSADVPQEDRSKALTDFTPRADGPPALINAHADIALTPPNAAVDNAANAAVLAAANLEIGAKLGAAKPASTDEATPIWSFFKLGVHHIATGWDHLMFLLGLVLLSGNLRKLTITVTAFTLAHSVTLGLAAFGLVNPPGAWVEALIAATIAYVGIVAISGWKNNHGPWLAFGFGLIHGFGFAGALSESLGSSNSLRLTGLISFNLGIEALQLSLVCLVVPLLRVLSRRPGYGAVYGTLASFVFLAGMGWFLQRTIGTGMFSIVAFGVVVTGLIAYFVMLHNKDRTALPG